MGVVNASSVFLPVFVVRLGGSNLAVSLLTVLPALTGFLFSIPAGSFLQTRRNVIPWYTAMRAIQYLVYAAMALASWLLPADLAVAMILVLWAAITLPGTISAIASNVVLNVAGPSGRYDLLGRRYGIMGLTTAITVALVGQVIGRLGFPSGYQVVFVLLSVAGLVACSFSIRIRVPDQPRVPSVAGTSVRRRLAAYAALLRGAPAFLGFLGRRFLLSFGMSMAVPLIPLWYIREAHAPDAWIGIIGTCQALGALAGYFSWRRVARRHGSRLVLVTTTFGIAVYPFALALTTELPVIAAIAVFGAVMAAGINLVLFDELMKTVPASHLVTFSGVDNSLANFAAIVAPLAGATLAAAVGIGGGLVIASVVTLLGAVLFSWSAIRRRAAMPAGTPGQPEGRVVGERG